MHLDETTGNSSARPPLNRGEDAPETHRGPSRRQVSHRRGHFKSRLGCHSCKRRRVKCDEVHPVCSGCRRLDLRCEYPSTVAGISHATRALSMASSSAIQAPLASLTLQDLRFYHQFLTVARPTIPLKSEDLWMQCAAMSHEVRSMHRSVSSSRSYVHAVCSMIFLRMLYSAWEPPILPRAHQDWITQQRLSSIASLPCSGSMNASVYPRYRRRRQMLY
jgi:hypothetical protein